MADIVLERKAYGRMLEWKETSQGTSALLIEGARRVGKSYLARRFAENEYRSFAVIDFVKIGKDVRDVFINDTTDLDTFFTKLQSILHVDLYRRESVLIFDEVQAFPRARELIKYLVEDGRYDYIETGSLMSIKYNVKGITIPSEEETLALNPLDFEEFLWANGDRNTVPALRTFFEKRQPLGAAMHRSVMNSFRKYMLVGGMPQSVLAFLKDGRLSDSDAAKRKILKIYRYDITKYADGYEQKVKAIFDSIPSQLSKKEKKFSITSLDKNARTREYEDAFMWLTDGWIVNECFNSTDPSPAPAMNLDMPTHKCYMADTGLLVTQCIDTGRNTEEEILKSVLLDKININEGALMENMVAQMLRANGHNLYFYSRHDREHRENEMEIDFLVSIGGKACPVEVKSSKHLRHTSLDKYMTKFRGRYGQPYVLYTKDVSEKDGVLFLPIYMAMFL